MSKIVVPTGHNRRGYPRAIHPTFLWANRVLDENPRAVRSSEHTHCILFDASHSRVPIMRRDDVRTRRGAKVLVAPANRRY